MNSPEQELINKKIRTDLLLQRVTMMLSFSAQLIPDLDIIEELSKYKAKKTERTESLTNSEIDSLDDIATRRLKALKNLIQVVNETEQELQQKKKNVSAMQKVVNEIIKGK